MNLRLSEEIEQLRDKLNRISVDHSSLYHPNIVELSQELDRLLNHYQRRRNNL